MLTPRAHERLGRGAWEPTWFFIVRGSRNEKARLTSGPSAASRGGVLYAFYLDLRYGNKTSRDTELAIQASRIVVDHVTEPPWNVRQERDGQGAPLHPEHHWTARG